MRIAVLGSGGVGGYFGGRLAAAGADVTFLARGAHLAAMRERGLRIDSPLGDVDLPHVSATDSPAEVGPVDIVLFTVKLYDTAAAIPALSSLMGPETLVVPLQNGVESVETLSRAIGPAHVAGGTCYVTAVIVEPGHLRHTSMGRMIFGPTDPAQSNRLTRLLEVCKGAAFDTTMSDRIDEEIWAKFARLTVFSGMTALTRCPLGTLIADPDLRAMMEAALGESAAVAQGKQVTLSPTLVADVMQGFGDLPAHAKSSMLEDLERGRRLELPWLSGAVVRMGEEVGIPTPTHRLIATILKPHVNGH
jgi:2-dehydropantoate 2-reductase